MASLLSRYCLEVSHSISSVGICWVDARDIGSQGEEMDANVVAIFVGI